MHKLIISNMPEDMDEDELNVMFKEYGLERVDLRPGKYALLTFDSDFAAMKAEREWGRAVMRGHWLKVKFAQW